MPPLHLPQDGIPSPATAAFSSAFLAGAASAAPPYGFCSAFAAGSGLPAAERASAIAVVGSGFFFDSVIAGAGADLPEDPSIRLLVLGGGGAGAGFKLRLIFLSMGSKRSTRNSISLPISRVAFPSGP